MLRALFILFSTVAALMGATMSTAQQEPARLALLIGNQDYKAQAAGIERSNDENWRPSVRARWGPASIGASSARDGAEGT